MLGMIFMFCMSQKAHTVTLVSSKDFRVLLLPKIRILKALKFQLQIQYIPPTD